MKTRKLSVYFMIIALAVLLVQCTKEGPIGPIGPAGVDGNDGNDGTNGVDGNVTCLACHSTAVKEAIDAQFNLSGHHNGEVTVGRIEGGGNWSTACQRCHTQEGYIAWAAGDAALGTIYETEAFECKMCHSIHTTFEAADYAFRKGTPVDWVSTSSTTEAIDFGSSNVCSACHQARVQEPNLATPGATFNITSTHYGPHHGPQSNVLYGSGFAEIPGSMSYVGAGENGTGVHMNADAKCVGCHMDNASTSKGGHTWVPNVATCNACHTTANFDYGGVQTETAGLLLTLQGLLEAQGVIAYASGDYYELNPETGVIELVAAAGSYHPVTGVHTMVRAQAFFNWVGLDEDRSKGVHNPKYVKALLTNSIEALTP